jgi:hypothetical protein
MTTNMTPPEDAIQDRDLPEIKRILSSIPPPSQDELDMLARWQLNLTNMEVILTL